MGISKDFITVINNYIKNRYKIYFISPHFDDAVYSAGGLMAFLSGKTNVEVVNVFTKADNNFKTISANKYLKKCKAKNAENLYETRKKEDLKVLSSLGIKVINLNFVDALFRKKHRYSRFIKLIACLLPEIIHIYPTYRWHVLKGMVSIDDEKLKSDLGNKLINTVGKCKKMIVFCPKAIGNHVDHLIVNQVCKELFDKVIYWNDYPYCLSKKWSKKNLFCKSKKIGVFKTNYWDKQNLMKKYKSQFKRTFGPEDISFVNEKYCY